MVKVGDLVTAKGYDGVFVVRIVSGDKKVVQLEAFNVSKQQAMGHNIDVPTSGLSPFKEDASQAAARIVREATEDH